MLERNAVEKYLENINDIKNSYALFDIHVHPFEVMGNGLTYTENPHHDGIFSVNSARYLPPIFGKLKISRPSATERRPTSPELQAKMATLTARQLYAHTGSRLFADHMQLSGIDRILLLPVLGEEEPDDLQMKMLREMFGADERFALGYSIPNLAANSEISGLVADAVQEFGVRAIKIHPNITGIDLSVGPGKERIEYILEAAGKAGLAVIVHGGLSPGVRNTAAASHGILRNLRDIDWGLSDRPVVIAHAGIYGHDLSQAEGEVLPLMNKLLLQHDNLFVDVAGLEVDQVRAVVKQIDHERIMFGSDALYSPQWSVLVKLMHCLKIYGTDHEDVFVKITSLNPSRYIFSADQ